MQTLGFQGAAAAGQVGTQPGAGSVTGDGVEGAAILQQQQAESPEEQQRREVGLHSTQPQQQQQQQVQGSAQQQAAQAAAAAASPGEGDTLSRRQSTAGVRGLWNQVQLGGSVLEVTRSQLAGLAAAASTCGAVLGAVLVVLLRPGSGAAGNASR